GDEESIESYKLLQQLREKGISSELFHEQSKMDKQFKYAEKKNIPYVIIIGSNELSSRIATIKNIITGEQKKVDINNLINEAVNLFK
ncbi:MAG TPA: His/Gly/Thr/Pro-type tRNA ligase C-terminal domain-containing protein, partial [Chitinophagaceae bacterium]|nr:His/Gly/Thr/Pro-type tRNA ligase C-terminal domain-containing protein [Chitinophagaceae bacterium]